MYSLSTYRGQPFVRTQRSAQFRWAIMTIGATTLGVAGSLAYNTFTNEYQQERSIAETSVLAQQVDSYKPQIQSALAQADDIAAEIGNEVADPATIVRFNALRNQARTVLAAKVEVPQSLDGPKAAYIDYEVADGMLALNGALVNNLQDGEKALRASHEAYQELVDAKAEAAAAKAALEATIPQGDQVLFDTAPSADGWIYVPEEIRIPLAEAIQEGHNALLATENKELSTVADFKGVAEQCRAAMTEIKQQSEVVKSNIKLPEPVIPLDENGNPIVVAPPAENQ